MRQYTKWTGKPFQKQIPVTAWGRQFMSIRELAKDSRCLVCYDTLFQRIKYGRYTPEEAASQPLYPKVPKIWGRSGTREIAKHPNCVVSRKLLSKRLNAGWNVELAATTPRATIKDLAEFFGLSRHEVKKMAEDQDLDTFEPKYLLWDYVRYRDIVNDPRCVVNLATLRRRLRQGWELEEAATTPCS